MNRNKASDDKLIDNFLNHTLTDQESIRFKQRLEDSTFKEMVASSMTASQPIKMAGRRQLLELLKLSDLTLDKKRPSVLKTIFLIGLMLAILAGLTYVVSNRTGTPDELFIAQYEKFPNMLEVNVRTNRQLSNRQIAMLAYDEGNYSKTLAILDTMQSLDSRFHIYRAIAHLELNNLSAAEAILITLKIDKQAKYKDAAQWYSCLVYLKQADLIRCQEELREIISNPEHLYLNKAIELNNKLTN